MHNDPLWLALERSKSALIADPSIIFTKKPEWADGLNTDGCNALAKAAGLGPIFTAGERTDPSGFLERYLVVHHPIIDNPIRWRTWSQAGWNDSWNADTRGKVSLTIAHLSAWQDHRAGQLRPAKADKGRQGRLPKDVSDAARAAMLTLLGRHPTLKDDPERLVKAIKEEGMDVSAGTVRRWLDEEENRYRESDGYRKQQDEKTD